MDKEAKESLRLAAVAIQKDLQQQWNAKNQQLLVLMDRANSAKVEADELQRKIGSMEHMIKECFTEVSLLIWSCLSFFKMEN